MPMIGVNENRTLNCAKITENGQRCTEQVTVGPGDIVTSHMYITSRLRFSDLALGLLSHVLPI